MWKFRTMEHGAAERIQADPDLRSVFEGHQFKLPDGHDLITPLGRLLRRSSLDELPQLVQVITGRMSLVGVRPIEPAELATRSPHDQAVYVSRRPGVTGLWQVQGRSAIEYHERLRIDHHYVTNWSLALDLKVLALTPLALVRTHEVA
jgi:lipopolysaccharide/colanic/teichoic acid biosynthesis glycosyltransferase